MQELFIVFLIGLVGAGIGSFVSGTVSVLTIAALLTLGIPPIATLGIYRVGIFGFQLGGLKDYAKSKNIEWSLVVPLSIIGAVGAGIGALLVVHFSEELLEKIIGLVILLFIPFTLLNKKLGTEVQVVSKNRTLFGHVCYFLSSIWSGSISIATGIFVSYTMLYFYGLTLLQAKGTSKIPGLVKAVVATGVFAFSGIILWDKAIVFFLGMLLGTWISTKYIIKLGNEWLRWITLFAIVLLALRLIFL